MNDFSKEELKEISFWLTRLAFIENKLDMLKPIHEKINYMIDNYCDHEKNIMTQDERERKFKIYHEQILPKYDNDPDKVPPYLEPDFNEGWK